MAQKDHKVLVVEDDEGVRSFMKLALEAAAYDVSTAASGQEGLDAVQHAAGGFDMVIIDVVMPKMSGCELADRLALLYPSLKILFISGYNDEVILRQGIMQRQVNFLRKPFTSGPLIAKVKEVLQK